MELHIDRAPPLTSSRQVFLVRLNYYIGQRLNFKSFFLKHRDLFLENQCQVGIYPVRKCQRWEICIGLLSLPIILELLENLLDGLSSMSHKSMVSVCVVPKDQLVLFTHPRIWVGHLICTFLDGWIDGCLCICSTQRTTTTKYHSTHK